MNNNSTIYNPSTSGGINSNDLMAEIQKTLLGQAGAISSSNSNIENTIDQAIQNLKDSNTASKAATSSDYDRQIADATTNAANSEASFREAQRGFATNMAALNDLRTNNTKTINDLNQRKQEALLSSDATTASKMSDLILQKYQFEQQAQQQVFSNLVSLNNIALQNSQENRLQQTQNFTEEQAINQVALKYGIEVKPGMTYQDVVNAAKPKASQEEQLALDQSTAQLELTKAQSKLALAQAQAAIQKNPNGTVSEGDVNTIIKSTLAANPKATADDIKADLLKNYYTNAAGYDSVKRQQVYDIVDNYFANKANNTSIPGTSNINNGTFSSPLANTGVAIGNTISDVGQSVLDFIFGKK